jgi:hypothetical protein
MNGKSFIEPVTEIKERIIMQRVRRTVGVGALAAMLATLVFAGSASAKLTGEYTKFQFCPFTNAEVKRCLHSVNDGGSVVLGSKKVSIVNPVTLQGGFASPVGGFSKFFAATNGVTLSKAAQPVPGGLAGLVNCPEISNFILRAACEWTFENALTGVNSTLELARPASEIKISETNLSEAEGVALKLPVKVRLENPFLGSNCYVGSESAPVWWELTAGTTSPPGPNKPITGESGEIEFLDGGRILKLTGTVLVDNAWAAPKTSGCGGIFSFLLDPIVSAASGLPAAAGTNTSILENTVHISSTAAVKKNDSENP